MTAYRDGRRQAPLRRLVNLETRRDKRLVVAIVATLAFLVVHKMMQYV